MASEMPIHLMPRAELRVATVAAYTEPAAERRGAPDNVASERLHHSIDHRWVCYTMDKADAKDYVDLKRLQRPDWEQEANNEGANPNSRRQAAEKLAACILAEKLVGPLEEFILAIVRSKAAYTDMELDFVSVETATSFHGVVRFRSLVKHLPIEAEWPIKFSALAGLRKHPETSSPLIQRFQWLYSLLGERRGTLALEEKEDAPQKELVSKRVLEEAKDAHADGSFEERLPVFLREIEQAVCTNEDKVMAWVTNGRSKWEAVLRGLKLRTRPVAAVLDENTIYPYQKHIAEVLTAPLPPGGRCVRWVACLTNRSGKSETAAEFKRVNPDGYGSLVMTPPFTWDNFLHMYKKLGEPGYVWFDLPMDYEFDDSFRSLVESVSNMGSVSATLKYDGGEVTLRCVLVVLSNSLPPAGMRGRDIQLLVVPEKTDGEEDASYQQRLRTWTDYEFKQFGLKRVVRGTVIDDEEPWAQALLEKFGQRADEPVDIDRMKLKEVRAFAKRAVALIEQNSEEIRELKRRLNVYEPN